MKLSLWMIANRLGDMDYETDIGEDDPPVLRSARRVYATNCVYIYQEGPDTICKADSGFIRLKDTILSTGFELIQDIFDFYDDWHLQVRQYLSEGEFQKLIDETYRIVTNPIAIYDANSMVLGIYSYGEDSEVNEEWAYQVKNRHASIEIIQNIRKNSAGKDWSEERPQKYDFKVNGVHTCGMNYAIQYEKRLIGRLTLIEHERKINPGDACVLEYIGKCYKESFIRHDSSMNEYEKELIYYMLLENEKVDEEILSKQLSYNKWDKDDVYQIALLRSRVTVNEKSFFLLMDTSIRQAYPSNTLLNVGDDYILLVNVTKQGKFDSQKLSRFFYPKNILISVSLHVAGIENIYYLYRQAIMGIEMSKWDDVSSHTKLESYLPEINFFRYASDAIMISADMEFNYHACNPDAKKIWFYAEENNSELFDTLYEYLCNNCSLKETTEALCMHKNTLTYRIKKISGILKGDLKDNYYRRYLLLSMRLVKIYFDYKKYVAQKE